MLPFTPAVSHVVRFLYDFTISCLQLIAGRILPALHVEETDLQGINVVVTGANSGIGLSIAKSLARQNATVFLACRSRERGEEAARQIIDILPDGTASKRVHFLQLDTSNLASVRSFADSWKQRSTPSSKIDILIHNAGISGLPAGQANTKDGIGMIYATNFLGSFLLTSLLESSLSDNARVIFTSSFGQYGGNPFDALSNPGLIPQVSGSSKTSDSNFYACTKSMQALFAKTLQRRWFAAGRHRVAHSFTPGYTYTPIFDKMRALPPAFDPVFWFLTTATMLSTPVEVGAATGVWLATTQNPGVTNPSTGGRYWDRCVARMSSADVLEVIYGSEKTDLLWNTWCRDSGAEWD